MEFPEFRIMRHKVKGGIIRHETLLGCKQAYPKRRVQATRKDKKKAGEPAGKKWDEGLTIYGWILA